MDADEIKDVHSELPELKAEIQNYKRALRSIRNLCDASHWTSDRRWKIRDLCNEMLKTPRGD